MGHARPEPSPPGQEMVFTSVHWLWEMKKTRAKGSERPLLSAANKLLAWYMWARSWKTCFSARERGSESLIGTPGAQPWGSACRARSQGHAFAQGQP